VTVEHDESGMPHIRACADDLREKMDKLNDALMEAWKAGIEVRIEESEHPAIMGKATTPMRLKIIALLEV